MGVQNIPISVEVDGEQLKRFDEVLMNRWRRASSLRRPLEGIAKYMLDEIDKNFNRRGVVFGSIWRRRKRSYAHRMLHKSGRMRGGFKSRVYSEKAVIENRTPYFKFHQRGTRHMPARKMWGITDVHSNQIRQRIQRYLVEEDR